MKFQIFLDFDGVLFDSVPEVYSVCQEVLKRFPNEYHDVKYEEFKEFRSYLTDAWQFNRLYSKLLTIDSYVLLQKVNPVNEDWLFANRFFEARNSLMRNDNWASKMKPYQFFYDIKPLLKSHPEKFLIISTRNEDSIKRTLEYNNIHDLLVFGQAAVRASGSKLRALQDAGKISTSNYLVYVDDMRSHLKPFRKVVDVCLQAKWGLRLRYFRRSFCRGNCNIFAFKIH